MKAFVCEREDGTVLVLAENKEKAEKYLKKWYMDFFKIKLGELNMTETKDRIFSLAGSGE
jgi:acylphosphatase